MQLTRSSYSTRSHVSDRIEKEITGTDPTIEFGEEVEFISRAAADEVIALAASKDATIDAAEAGEDVQKMIAVVLAGLSEEPEREVEIHLADEVSIPPTGA